MGKEKNQDSKNNRRTLRARIEGVVQGVGFRYSTVRQARSLELRGYVRNLWDGTVEVVAEGPEERLQQLERWLHRGPPGAIVRRVDSRYSRFQGIYRSFDVDY
jgi:acylphosphatase